MNSPQKAPSENAHVYMSGVPIEQFLQLVEVDRKTCTVLIRSGERNGRLHFREGAVIEADADELRGIDAAFRILAWDDEPEISVQPPEADVETNITESISFIMMESARVRDEGQRDAEVPSDAEAPAAAGTAAGPRGQVVAYPSGQQVAEQDEEEGEPAEDEDLPSAEDEDDRLFEEQVVAPCVRFAAETKGIDKMALVLRDGTLVAEHNGGEQLGTLLAYLAMEGERIRQALQVTGPRWITLNCESGDRMIALLGTQLVLGLLAKASVAPQKIIAGALPLIQTANAG